MSQKRSARAQPPASERAPRPCRHPSVQSFGLVQTCAKCSGYVSASRQVSSVSSLKVHALKEPQFEAQTEIPLDEHWQFLRTDESRFTPQLSEQIRADQRVYKVIPITPDKKDADRVRFRHRRSTETTVNHTPDGHRLPRQVAHARLSSRNRTRHLSLGRITVDACV